MHFLVAIAKLHRTLPRVNGNLSSEPVVTIVDIFTDIDPRHSFLRMSDPLQRALLAILSARTNLNYQPVQKTLII